jgi:hypothetical protein
MLTDADIAAMTAAAAPTLVTVTRTLEAVIVPAGRYDHCSRGKGSIRNKRSGATEWAEQEGNRFRIPCHPGKGWSTWYQKSSDGFNRTSDTTVEVPPQLTVTVSYDPAVSTEDAALREAVKAAGYAIGGDETAVWA